MKHPTGRLEAVTVPMPSMGGAWTNHYVNGATVVNTCTMTTWMESRVNPYKGSWRRPLWWLDDWSHGHLSGRMHRLVFGWLCDFLDRGLW